MIIMRKRLLSLALGATLALGVFACSDDDTPGTTTPIDDTTSSTEPVGS